MINRDRASSLMPGSATMGVILDGELLLLDVVQGKRVLRSLLLPADASRSEGLLEYLWDAGLQSVWVMPATRFSRTATSAWLEQARERWVVMVQPDPHEATRPIRALLWPKERNPWEARRLALAFPEFAGWNWKLTDARSLLATASYLDQLLSRPVVDAPGLLAHELLDDLTRDTAISSLRSTPFELPGLPDSDGTPVAFRECARELAWRRPLTVAEQRQRYVHKYVHLSWPLQAAMTARLGAGAPRHSSNGRAYDGLQPGIWHVHAEPAGSVFNGKHLPGGFDREWMSTPQVMCCQDIGYQVQVREGWYWHEAHEPLKRWATTLWQAAARLHTQPQLYRHAQGRANASRTITQLAQLGTSIIAQEQATGGWGRPDWLAQVAGLGQALLFAQLVRLVRKGSMPFLVDGDAFWVVSDEANTLSAVPGLLAAQRWRGYAAGYDVPLVLSSEVKDAFKQTQQPGELARALDTQANGVFP